MTLTVTNVNCLKHKFYFLIGQPQVNIEFNYDQGQFDKGVPTDNLNNFRELWEMGFIRQYNGRYGQTH